MHVLTAESLLPYNTLALDARAKALLSVGSERSLLDALDWAAAEGLQVVPLGEGSNVVFAGDIEALVLRMENRGIEVLRDDDNAALLRVAAGESWHSLVQWAIQQGFCGLENLALIPGTVGAAPIQNIGAYGVELASFVHRVHCVDIATGVERIFDSAACQFGYRDSVFKHSLRDQLIITAVDFAVSRVPCVQVEYPVLARALEEQGIDNATPGQVFNAVVSIRGSKLPDPARVPNAGSFFKNPVVRNERASELARQFSGLPQYPQADGKTKLPAAWLIEHCGWKGHRRDGLGVHPEHALVLVNYGSNNGKALLELAGEISASVLDVFDIRLEIEPRIYGSSE
jgi:UDP-N-acetylmuramate dehydrogenase